MEVRILSWAFPRLSRAHHGVLSHPPKAHSRRHPTSDILPIMVERKRHLAKAVSYRLFGSLATAVIAFAFTGRADIAAGVGVADTIVKIGLYYMHERMWYRIRWGVHPGEAEHLPARVD